MPFDLKAIKKALEDFSVFAENLVPLFQNLPKALLEFAENVK